jgi:hypothetical protein
MIMLHSILTYLAGIWHTMYLPKTGPWYSGAVWANAFVMPICAVLAYAWAKSKFWPLRPITHGITHLHQKMDSLHDKHDALDAKHDELHELVKSLHEKVDKL